MSNAEDRKRDRKIIFTEFSDNITLITLGVLSLAYLNQLIYYSFFSIPIHNYIQVGELITLFVPSLFDYLFQGLLPIIIAYILIRATIYIESKKVESANNLGKDDEYEIISIIKSTKGIKNLFTKKSIQKNNF